MPPSVSTLKPLLILARAALGAVTFNHSTKPREKAPHESHNLTQFATLESFVITDPCFHLLSLFQVLLHFAAINIHTHIEEK